MDAGRLHLWNVNDHVNERIKPVRTFLECIISDVHDFCIDVITYDDDGDGPSKLGQCRPNAKIARGFTRILWESTSRKAVQSCAQDDI